VRVLGTQVDAVNMETAIEWAEDQFGKRTHRSILAVNPEKVVALQRNPSLRRFFNTASLLIPDGIGVVVAARLVGSGSLKISRVPGCELMPLICESAARRGRSIFAYGAAEDVNAAAVATLRERYPDLNVAGRQNGYLPEDRMPELVDRINESGADILFVGLGSPRQELWMERYLPSLDVSLCQGVGGTLDVLAGRSIRAPKIVRQANLEWAFRLFSQPLRIFRQTALPLFASQLFIDLIKTQWRRGVSSGDQRHR